MKIIIGASKSNKIGSKIIRFWINQTYSHVYAKWTLSTQDRDIIYQASHGMVHFCSLENFTKQNSIVKEFTIDISDDKFKDFSRKCVDLAGVSYSKLQLLQIVLSDISNGKLLFKDQHGYICSELMCELLEGLGLKFNKPKHLVRPDDIIKALEKFNYQEFPDSSV